MFQALLKSQELATSRHDLNSVDWDVVHVKPQAISQSVFSPNGGLVSGLVKVPRIQRQHLDMTFIVLIGTFFTLNLKQSANQFFSPNGGLFIINQLIVMKI